MSTPAILIQSALAATATIDALLLLFLLFRQQKGPVFLSFLFHVVGLLGWSVSVLFTLRTADPLAMKLTFFFAMVLAITKVVFSDAFPENTFRLRPAIYVAIVPSVIMMALTLFDNTVFTSFLVEEGRYATIENGPLAGFYALMISGSLLYSLALLYNKYRTATHRGIKTQLRYLFIGFSLSFLIGLATNELLPVLFHIYSLNATGPIFSLILVAFTVYIITRHHFLSIRVLIQRSLVFAMLLAGTIVAYLLLVTGIGYLAGKETDAAVLLSVGLTIFLGIWGTPVVERFFRKLTDPIFFKNPYDMGKALRELTEIGNFNIEPEAIVEKSQAALLRILKVHHVTFLFPSKEGMPANAINTLKEYCDVMGIPKRCGMVMIANAIYQPKAGGDTLPQHAIVQQLLREYHAEIALPIILEQKLLGMLLLGTKRSGDAYTRTDITLLEHFAAQIAVALEKAFLYRQIAEYSTLLEKRVEERTREVLTLREEERQMMLDISHGLQTPLTIIKNELGKIKTDSPHKAELEVFEHAIDKASKFIYDLLRLSRLDKMGTAAYTDVDISDLIEEVAEYFEVSARELGVTVRTEIGGGMIIYGDKDELTEAISNILGNALKYMRDGKERDVCVSLVRENDRIRLCIRDSGVGITKTDLPHLFERFYRAQGTQKQKGSGLGLAITKRIVERHGGTISVESTEGVGSTFIITFPSAEMTKGGE